VRLKSNGLPHEEPALLNGDNMAVTFVLTDKQAEKLYDILDNAWDEGPPSAGWASQELSQLRAIVFNAIDDHGLKVVDDLFSKNKPYRDPRILALAQEVAYCFYCKEPNHGQVVACHSNSQKFGHGMGQKASDFPVAYLCDKCHALVDGRIGPHLSRVDREMVWYEGACLSCMWLMSEGYLEVK
jgi:hypothetical protein